jgi:indole-3-glycerol phosphate synthase
MSILDEIFSSKKLEVSASRQMYPESTLAQQVSNTPIPTDFISALRDESRPRPRLIAEVKQRSPSKGVLCHEFDASGLAQTYAANGAAAISVITECRFFGGSLQALKGIHEMNLGIPLLRKDFIFDEYQLLEARVYGASAFLLIVAMLEIRTLSNLIRDAENLDITPLVEIYTLSELDMAIRAGARLIGINNRDLHTFSTDLETTINLLPHIPSGITVVSESGIRTNQDVTRLANAGVDAILVGESIVSAADPAEKVTQFSRFENQELTSK